MTGEIIDIHGSKRKFDLAMMALEGNPDISERNKETIKKLIRMKSHVSFHTKVRDIYSLNFIAMHLKKDFEKVTNDDLHRLFDEISDGRIVKPDGKMYRTTRHLKKAAKELYVKVIRKKGVIRDIKFSDKLKELSRKDFWTREEILSFPDHATTLMDKALVSFLSLGCNISEYARLLISDIDIGEDCIIVSIRNSKNSHRTRTVYLYENNVHIINWIDSHPLKNSPDFQKSPMFLVRWGDRWKVPSYNFFEMRIRKVAKKVNPEKPSNTHIFRNSVAFWKHQSGMHDLELNRSMGWAIGSNMKARYIRCDDERVREEELRIRGLSEVKEKKIDEVIKCLRCQTKYTNIDLDKVPHCARCGFTMNSKLREEEIIRKQDNMELYAKAIAFTKSEKRDKLAQLPTITVVLNETQREEIKSIVLEVMNNFIKENI